MKSFQDQLLKSAACPRTVDVVLYGEIRIESHWCAEDGVPAWVISRLLADRIPDGHLAGLREINCVPGLFSGSSSGLEAGRYEPLARIITISRYEREEILETLAHEIGHNCHRNHCAQRRKEQWDLLHRSDAACVSPYAQTSQYEDFAETYAAWIYSNGWLRRHSPRRYAFMREVFSSGPSTGGEWMA